MWMLCSMDLDAYFMNSVEFAAMETVRSTAVAKLFGNRNNFDYPDLSSTASHNSLSTMDPCCFLADPF